MRGIIFDIDRFAVHDGPGLRTAVYLKGCPLGCVWCHSPESRSGRPEPLRVPDRCCLCGRCCDACTAGAISIAQGTEGKRLWRQSLCTGCGECVLACPAGALSLCGSVWEARDVVKEAAQDIAFFKNTGGGATLTGGEVLAQAQFAAEILRGLKALNIHTIVETSGAGAWPDLEALMAHTDIFYFDLKAADPVRHKEFTGVAPDGILTNLRKLRDAGSSVTLRMPLIPGCNDSAEDVSRAYRIAREFGIQEVHLLPYNASAGAKYAWLGLEYQLGARRRQEPDYLARLVALAPSALKVSIVG